jgi:hypothetical protein
MKPLFVLSVLLIAISCNNPQSPQNVIINNDARLLGKWKQLQSANVFIFNKNGSFDLTDTNHEGVADFDYSDQYRTDYDKYITISYHIGAPHSDTITLVPLTSWYDFNGDTLLMLGYYYILRSNSNSLVGKWQTMPIRQYRIRTTIIYNSAVHYVEFDGSGDFTNDFQWYGNDTSILQPYHYVDRQSYFEFMVNWNNQWEYVGNIYYEITDSLLFLQFPPIDPDSSRFMYSKKLVRQR